MKKTLFIAALLVAGVASAFATEYTAKAYITMGTNTLKLREAAEFSTSAYDNGADLSAYNKTGIVAYATLTGNTSVRWSQFAGDNLEGVQLAFKVAAAGEQTLTFSDVQGAQLYLVDGDKYIAIVNGGSYTFTAEEADVADWNVTRFSISKNPPYLFVDGIVTIGELKDGETIYFQYFTYVDGKRVNGIAGDTNRNKSFEPYTTEGYCEIWYTNKAGVERKFIVNPAPVVTPAN